MGQHQFLDEIVDIKKRQVAALYASDGIDALEEKAKSQLLVGSPFYSALCTDGLSLIAEVKKASPSKGIINRNFDPSALAARFAEVGAACISVLTETEFFKGDPAYVAQVRGVSGRPVLRKDFILDPIQVFESRILGADALLLILAMLSDEKAQQLHRLARELGLSVLVEVHTQEEFDRALLIEDVQMIGVNNRNLSTFEVDTQLASTLREANASRLPEGCLTVAESGYNSGEALFALDKEGFDAVLVGEGIVTHPEILDEYQNLRSNY
jgi:indole-3-glycerol phosphate synthase